jgi:cytochrome oxidase Cu insertion factor (SCO1/SenC/PrrC family)
VRMLAVTVDPRHDTPAAVRRFLAARGALGHVDYLLGSERALSGVWRRWKVAVNLGPGRRTTGHSSVIYGIDARGRMALVYPSDIPPQALVGDVPRLLG